MIFKTQVEKLTSLDLTSETTKLDQYLTNGAADVINKVIELNPDKKILFVRKHEASPSGSITVFGDGPSAPAATDTTVISASHGLSDGDIVNITGTTNYNVPNLVIFGVGENSFDIAYPFTANDATGTWTQPKTEVDVANISKEIASVTIGHEGLSFEESEETWGDITAEWYPTTYECVPISPSRASLSKHPGSLHYRTISDAGWYMEDNKIKTIPETDGASLKMRVYYVDYPTVGNGVEPSSLTYFPKQYVHLIPLNAAISILQDNYSQAINIDEDIELSQIQIAQHTKLKGEYNEAFSLLAPK